MRRSVIAFLVINAVILVFLIHSVFTLLELLIEDGSADALSRAELPALDSTVPDLRPALIPKIVHQTWKNETIPEIWRKPRQDCIDIHPDYEYKLWTDASSLDFIEKEFPWFVKTFRGYGHPIQRADAIRYFVLAKYGGIYIDLDDGCNRPLDPLLIYPAFLHRTIPTGISNDVMGSIPEHPFFLRVINSLEYYDRNWILPYITVMYSTGPLFLSVIWKQYINVAGNSGDAAGLQRVRVLSRADYADYDWSFFKVVKGSSWHEDDAGLIFWMGSHWVFLTAVGFLIAGVVGFVSWWAYRKIFMRGQQRPGRISMRKDWNTPWKWGWRSKPEYELVDRHDHDV
ncbi:MAG: hypothetical protein MMC33_001122 [Icmadophila ericetorum]|nr:hypothetical protein [Icmadophila ericetorum]